jgi:PAS domain S-box-containing protein
MASTSDNPSKSPENKPSHPDGLYRELFNLTTVIKLIIDPDTLQIVEANPAACQFYGYSQEQIQQLSLADINALPEPIVRTIVQEVMAGTKTTFETRHRLASGEIRDVEVQAGLLSVEGKRYLYAIIQDITEQKRMENALRQSERLYRLFAQNMPDSSVVMFDTDMRHTLVEGPFLKRLGTAANTMLGRLPHETELTPEVLAFMVPIYQRALQGESFSYERQTPNYAYEAHVAPLLDENGQIIGGMILSHDITERKNAEDAFYASEMRYQTLVDLAPVGIAELDLEGNVLHRNQQMAEISGVSDVEWQRTRRQTGAIHPDDQEKVIETIQAGLKTQQPQNLDGFRVLKPDGSIRWVSSYINAIVNDSKQVSGYILVSLDITSQKQTADALKTSEEQFRSTFEYASIGMALVGLDGQWLDVNPALCRIVGYPTEELLHKTFQDITHPADLELDLQNVRQLVAGEIVSYQMEKRYFHKEGHVVWVLLSVSLVHDKAGAPLYFISQIQDISESKRFENELRRNEEQLRFITNNIQDMITRHDSQDRIIYASPSCRILLGYKPEEMTSHSTHEFTSPDDWDRMYSVQQQITQQRLQQGVIETHLRHADGHYVDVETVARFLYDGDGKYSGGIFVNRDITERKQMENLLVDQQRLQTSLEKEQELSSLKTRMMERIAHEFRTPLTTIQIATETLIHYHDRLTPEKREEKSVTVKNQIQRITQMLDEIGMVIRGADTLGHLSLATTDLDDLCHKVAAELSTTLKLPDKYVIEVQGKALASIDPNVIRDSLTHIMRNAARYSEPADPVMVRIAAIGNCIELRITDEGIGIAADELPRIFEPFFRGSNINERGGLGIGLTIARAAIEAHGGTIRAESEPGKGTTFIITLPTNQRTN